VKRDAWDDEDDWPKRRYTAADIPPEPKRRASIVVWMYVVAAALILFQILHFYFG